jgi:hypothetical protein
VTAALSHVPRAAPASSPEAGAVSLHSLKNHEGKGVERVGEASPARWALHNNGFSGWGVERGIGKTAATLRLMATPDPLTAFGIGALGSLALEGYRRHSQPKTTVYAGQSTSDPFTA